MKKTFTAISFIALFSYIVNAQNNVWNATSFKFSTSISSLENMTGATLVTFPVSGVKATSLISFPSGFKFRYGVDEFSQFSLSAYGFLKFGKNIDQSIITNQDSVIVPFSNGANQFVCSYKLMGTFPSRKFIVEWSGVFSGGNQQVKFQLWLTERIGKIDFVNQGVVAFGGPFQYSSFCKTKILKGSSVACIDVQTTPQIPIINYAAIVSNGDEIPANTKYSFEPDTLKPKKPLLTFSNLLPACFSVNVIDSSTNESAFYLERKINSTNYLHSDKYFSTTVTGIGNSYVHNETQAKPDSLYTFRGFASNGFVNSDTSIITQLTPMPLIAGIKKIPGDYPTINALLQDAVCKHLGPNLVIELQSNYSFASEGGTVKFNPNIHNKLIQSITIRLAANVSSLVLNNSGAYPMFMIDSISNVHIDGRANGQGTTNNLTLNQVDQTTPAIIYLNNANKGGVHFVNVQGEGRSEGLIFLGRRNLLNYDANNLFAVNDAVINNCKIGPSSGFTYKGLVIEEGNNNVIRENEFFRFFDEAIKYTDGGANSRIVKNRLYQPEEMVSQNVFYGATALGAIVVTDVKDNFRIDSNKIGGSAPNWGVGVWKQNFTSTNNGYGMIRVMRPINNVSNDIVYISNNEFGNINTVGSNFLYQINNDCPLFGLN